MSEKNSSDVKQEPDAARPPPPVCKPLGCAELVAVAFSQRNTGKVALTRHHQLRAVVY